MISRVLDILPVDPIVSFMRKPFFRNLVKKKDDSLYEHNEKTDQGMSTCTFLLVPSACNLVVQQSLN